MAVVDRHWVIFLVALIAMGCRTRPACDPIDAKGCVVEKITVEEVNRDGDRAVDEDAVKDGLATAQSSRFVSEQSVAVLGESGEIFLHYDRLDPLVLERDLARVERRYQAAGFHLARVRAGRVFRTSDSTVKVQIVVDPGPETRIAKTTLTAPDGGALQSVHNDLKTALDRAQQPLATGARFSEENYDEAKRALLAAFTDRGYRHAEITGKVSINLEKHEATISFVADLGPLCTFGEVNIVGHGDLPRDLLLSLVDIDPGEPFSTEVMAQAESALAETGLFSTVRVTAAPTEKTKDSTVPVVVAVQRASMRSIVVGGGAELGSRIRAHLLTTWEHKHFLGGMRHFNVDARTGVLFFPLQLLNWNPPAPGLRPLPEIRTRSQLSQPGLFELKTRGFFRIEGKFYRPETADSNVSQAGLLFENLELYGAVGLTRRFAKNAVAAGASLNGQFVMPVAMYSSDLPSGFAPISIPYGKLDLELDLRKNSDDKHDAFHPHSGFFAGVDVQVAGVIPEGAVDVRIRPEVRGFIPLGSRVTLALRAAGGLLFPFGYGARLLDGTTCTQDDDSCNAERARSLQIMQLRGFYSGGIDTNRGYPKNGVNPQEVVLALFDTGQQASGLTQRSPIGGRYLWEAQVELRFPIYKLFGAAIFADASDAWYDTLAFRPHFSPGFSLRLDTDIGPLRADVGFRVPCAQVIGTCTELAPENGGPPTLLGVPLNVSIAIGNAF